MSISIQCSIPTDLPAGLTLTTKALTMQAIKERYDLEFKEVERIKKELYQMTMLDILFHYPDGPYRAIALNMFATPR